MIISVGVFGIMETFKMKSQLENKLNKLPDSVVIGYTTYVMFITKCYFNDHDTTWYIEYKDEAGNAILIVEHTSLQAAVDTTLSEIKQYVDEEYKAIEFLKKYTGYKLNK